MTKLATALDYAARGWAVFPCLPRAKEPATRRGFKDATTNPATIRRWWLANPDYNIGIATGIASGIFVLDPDGSIGTESLIELEIKHGALPPTLCSTTSAGCHLWFKLSTPLQSSPSRVGRFIDIRADDAYVLAPPSIHPDGDSYRWRNTRDLAIAPEWLVQLARKRPTISERAFASVRPPSQHGNGLPDAYGQAALDREIAALAAAAPGTRNHALNRASFSLHQLVAGGELSEVDVRTKLIEAACANGLMTDPNDGPRKVELTIRSGARAGLQHPRTRGGAL
jgi:putative DNA primase/helicase